MNAPFLAIALSYVFGVALLCLILIRAQLPSAMKLGLVGVAVAFHFWHFYALVSITGWPTRESLPENFELLASRVVQPDSARGFAGEIHLWILPEAGSQPRGYQLPYARSLHELLVESDRRRGDGSRELGRVSASPAGVAVPGWGENRLELTQDKPAPLPKKQ